MSIKWMYSLLIVGIVSISAFGLTNAWFSDVENSSENKFTAGTLDLKIDDTDTPDNILTVTGLSPGNSTEKMTKLEIKGNPGQIWLMIKSAQRKEDLSFMVDTVITSTKLTDVMDCWIPLGTWEKDTPKYITQTFKLAENLENWTATESMNIEEDFLATQMEDHNYPASTKTWDAISKKCL